jgi:hypothetical protein
MKGNAGGFWPLNADSFESAHARISVGDKSRWAGDYPD